MSDDKQRTTLQNKAMHLWFTQLSTTLNDAGLDIRETLKDDFEIPWTETSIKELMWKPVQKIMFGKESTTKPTPAQYIEIYEVINRKMAEKGVYVPWPTDYERSLKGEG